MAGDGALNDLALPAAASGEGLGEALGAAGRGGPSRPCRIEPGRGRLAGRRADDRSRGHRQRHHPCPSQLRRRGSGQASDTDFLIFTRSVQDLAGGVFLNVGTAVVGPEVFLKALSMARNVARQRGESVHGFTTAVFDLIALLPADWRGGPPGKEHPQYYFRPWKTILSRTVADGGTSYFFCGDHRQTLPTLWHRLTAK